MDGRKIGQYLVDHQNAIKVFEQDYFNLAICHIHLGNYDQAKGLFEQAILRMLEPHAFWDASGQPNWLVDVFVLSGRMDLYPNILQEITRMRINSTRTRPIGSSLPAQYCYSVMELIQPGSGNVTEWINHLLRYPKTKQFYTIWQCLQAIITKDRNSFELSLSALLKVHEGKEKYGELKSTPEGWLCMPAMTLAVLAVRRSLELEIINEYFSTGYLTFLKERI